MPKSSKVEKPYPDFPLFPHASGRWAKKIRGDLHYFGRWGHKQGAAVVPVPDFRAGWEAALTEYEANRDALQRGLPRQVSTGVYTLRDLANDFLHAQRLKVDSGDVSGRHWHDLYRACEQMADALGRSTPVATLQPSDFGRLRSELAKTLGVESLSNAVRRIRQVFRWGWESGKLPAPMRMGPDFKQPSVSVKRKAKNERGGRSLDAAAIRELLKNANPHLRAAILLGINCGYGNSDVGELPLKAVDLERRVIDWPRPKTGIARRAILWPETVAALRESLASRPEPKDKADAGLFFITRQGRPMVRDELIIDAAGKPKRHNSDAVGLLFNRLLSDCSLKRAGVGFYALRHMLLTIGEGANDDNALDLIMGHEVKAGGREIRRHYREASPMDDRLRAVSEHVRAWLWPETQSPAAKPRTRQTGEKRRTQVA